MRRVLLLLAFVAACGGNSSSPTSTVATTARVEVRVVVKYVGLGCFNAPVGTGSRLTVKDGRGTVVAQGTFALTPGAEICDWTASVDVAGSPEFLTFEGNRGAMATVSRSDYQDGRVTLTVTVDRVDVS